MSMRSRSKVPDGKKRYSVGGVITISIHTEVVAASPEEAKKIALTDGRGLMSLCHQCASGEPDVEWITSGELDGDLPDEATVEVLEL